MHGFTSSCALKEPLTTFIYFESPFPRKSSFSLSMTINVMGPMFETSTALKQNIYFYRVSQHIVIDLCHCHLLSSLFITFPVFLSSADSVSNNLVFSSIYGQ